MEISAEILNELKEISPLLASIDRSNVFEVPEGYFSDLEKKITRHVLFYANKPQESLRVPEGYFDTLSEKILSKIKDEEMRQEIKTISPMLDYLKDENIFEVPEGYFEELSDRIFDKIKHKNVKVVSITKMRRLWQFAAAAVVTAGIIVSSLFIFNRNSASGPENPIATSALPDYVEMSHQFESTAQLQNGINSLSDDEISMYLQQNGSILDNDLLINDTDTKSLPDPVEYLSDENILNDILNQING